VIILERFLDPISTASVLRRADLTVTKILTRFRIEICITKANINKNPAHCILFTPRGNFEIQIRGVFVCIQHADRCSATLIHFIRSCMYTKKLIEEKKIPSKRHLGNSVVNVKKTFRFGILSIISSSEFTIISTCS